MLILRVSESTAARRRVPLYLVDDTDGKTPETGITFSASDIKISKNGAAESNSAGTVTELAGGSYYYEFTAGELDTPGFINARFTKSGVRTFVAVHQVTQLSVYDTNGINANVVAINDSGDAADRQQAILSLGMTSFAVNGVITAGDFTLTGSDIGTQDAQYAGAFLLFTTGANKGISRVVSVFTGSTKRVQFNGGGTAIDRAFPFAPSASDAGYLIGVGR